MRFKTTRRILSAFLIVVMLTACIPTVFAADSSDNTVPGSILASVQIGYPRSISIARNIVKNALIDYDIESIGVLSSTKTQAVFQIILSEKTEGHVQMAVSDLQKTEEINYAKVDDNEFGFCIPDDFEPGCVIVSGSFENLLKDFEIESVRLLTPGASSSVYCVYFKEKNKEIVWKALEILETNPYVKYASPNVICHGSVEPDNPTDNTNGETVIIDIPDSTEVSGSPVEIIKGDADCDGVLSITDATLIQRNLVGICYFSDTQLLAADTDGDGFVSITDVTMIQRKLVGIISEW